MVSSARIVVINDNIPKKGLKNTWGWSAYVDLGDEAVLFDADTRPDIIQYNMNKLGLDVEKLSFAVLSHTHGDHYGGFEYIGKVRPGLKIFVPSEKGMFLRDWQLKPIVVREFIRPTDDILISDPIRTYPLLGLKEIALGIRVEGVGLIVVVGCSHPGVDKIAMRLKEVSNESILMVIGGYHSPSRGTIDNLAKIAKYICPTHCTGDKAKAYIKEKYPEKYCEVRTGTEIIINKNGLSIND